MTAPSQARLRRLPCRSGIPAVSRRSACPHRSWVPERETGPGASVSWQETRTSRASRSMWIRGRDNVADAAQAGFSGQTLHGVIQTPGQDPRRAARARQHRHPHPVRDTRHPGAFPRRARHPGPASPRSAGRPGRSPGGAAVSGRRTLGSGSDAVNQGLGLPGTAIRGRSGPKGFPQGRGPGSRCTSTPQNSILPAKTSSSR